MTQPPPPGQRLRDLVGKTLSEVARTHKCHEKERELLSTRARRIRAANTLLLAVSSTGLLTTLITQQPAATWVAAITTFTSLLFSLWQLQLAPESQAAAHKDAANKYHALRNRCRALVASMDTIDEPALQQRYADLLADLERLTAASPPTSPKAFQLTKGQDD